MRGSEHSAFIEMMFLWAGAHTTDPRYRYVTLPKGSCIKATNDPELFEVRDKYDYPRAFITLPGIRGPVPSIRPARRFEPGAESVNKGWRTTVAEWGQIILRGTVFTEEDDAFAEARAWLDEHKGGWDGYNSAVNFSGKPPR